MNEIPLEFRVLSPKLTEDDCSLHIEKEINPRRYQIDILLSKRFQGHHVHIQVPSLGAWHSINNTYADETILIRTAKFAVAGIVTVILISRDGQPTQAAVINSDLDELVKSSDSFTIGLYNEKPLLISYPLLLALKENIRKIESNWTRLSYGINLATESLARAILIPELKHRQRVASHVASNDSDGRIHFEHGRIHATQLVRGAQAYGLKGSVPLSVLDWGVGCGRIARHLPVAWRSEFHGIDVDPVNIDWCQRNMGFGSYDAVDVRHKGPIASKAFDLIYGYSVMTHLLDSDQEFWLQKLVEMLTPEGLIIITVHGIHHACYYDWTSDPQAFARFIEEGFQRGREQNPDIADVTPANYYTDVSNTAVSIVRRWSKFADILDIIPNGLGGHDAVVLRRKH